jgi:hypothetical protein
VYLPLIFFFNRNPGLYLPFIALQYHEVRIDFDLASTFETYLSKNPCSRSGRTTCTSTPKSDARFAQKGHEYLIEQVQHTGSDTVTAGSTSNKRLSTTTQLRNWSGASTTQRLVTSSTSLWNFTSAPGASDIVLESNTYADVSGNCFVPITQASGVPLLKVGEAGSTPSSPKKSLVQ